MSFLRKEHLAHSGYKESTTKCKLLAIHSSTKIVVAILYVYQHKTYGRGALLTSTLHLVRSLKLILQLTALEVLLSGVPTPAILTRGSHFTSQDSEQLN